ncbi:hypothetical protein F5972_08740 [Microbispora cellulosiformans]|uniref:Uncharacterized protein n=1 Tax=Microbispora cellulosiformans TaxID=2614688 RepID=A0A5J5K600_9ACTN|nr:hypothetical protein [Microbispora cellulosiformans]KAA9379727.1 hypothetical protein F5972_08740 [Microbispora cellulosiformans]
MPVDQTWRHLGDQLVRRRVQLDPAYRTRRGFVAATRAASSDAWYRVITSLELGERDNYTRETIAAAEAAYRLQPGSIRSYLETGAPLQFLDDDADAPARPQQPPRYDDPVLQYLWDTPDPGLTESQREALVQVYLALTGAAARGGASAAPDPPAPARTA